MFEDNIVPDMTIWGFMKELSNYAPPVFSAPRPGAGESVSLNIAFNDPAGLLETAIFSLSRLLDAAGYTLTDGGTTITLRQAETDCFEAYRVAISEKEILLEAADTEGMRRAIYELEDQILANDGSLPTAELRIERRPFIKTRLGRCPFSPIKRWPVNTDELLDDVDYYPDEYLETLAHEGVNGIWIVTALREIGVTSLCPIDPQREKRIRKLARVAKKTRRYGIRLYLFMIEPLSVAPDDLLLSRFPELFGPVADNGRYTYCPCSKHTQKYLHEMLSSVFSAVPDLGGVVDINIGERPTSCLSCQQLDSEEPLPCQSRCGQSFGEIYRQLMTTMNDGIHAGAPDAKLISWFYMPQVIHHAPWVEQLSKFAPEDVVVQANFESGGEKIQLGRRHLGVDYWVSYDGPAKPYIELAKNRVKGEFGAKLQLGCGYELTPVACIPAPGIAYRKYQAMNQLGVHHVMQSWFVGNFPDVMSRAMGKLAFTDLTNESQETFLERLARPYWREDAPTVAAAWKLFDEAYQNFPFNVLFQYYAPQNSMPRWKFHFLPDLDPLAPPWKPNFPFGGDAIGEALTGFTIEECLELLERMVTGWNRGLELLKPLKAKTADNRDRQLELGTADCIGCLLEGTWNMLKFYRLRRDYIGGKREALSAMRELVEKQMALYRRMLPLVIADSRLGFHGEALTHLFSESSIRQALADAEQALAFAQELAVDPRMPFEQALAHGAFKLAEPGTPFTVASEDNAQSFSWQYDVKGNDFVVTIRHDWPGKDTLLQLFFMDLTGTVADHLEIFKVKPEGVTFCSNSQEEVTGFKTKLVTAAERHGDTVTLTFPLAALPRGDADCPFIRFNILLDNQYANGKGWPVRLYKGSFKGSFNPHEALGIRVDGK